MVIKAPSWCEHAIPGLNGWEDPDTGEVFASTKFTDAERAEFYGEAAPAPEPVYIPDAIVEIEDAAPIPIEAMSKNELEDLGREHGVELDRRQSRKVLIAQMTDVINANE